MNISEENRSKRQDGKWSKEEHQKFIQGLKIFGKDWKKLEQLITTRSGTQIRSHSQKFFLRIQKEIAKEEKSDKENQDPQQIVRKSSFKLCSEGKENSLKLISMKKNLATVYELGQKKIHLE